MSKPTLRLLLLFGFVVLGSAPAWSQGPGLTGTVTDPTGAVVTGAKVTLTNEATRASRTTTTAADGAYIFPQLAPGSYKVEVRKEGFKTAVREHITVAVGLTSTLDIRLEVGAVAETVVVEAAVAGINTSDASVGNVIGERRIKELPLEARNIVGLLSLQPAVVFLPKLANCPPLAVCDADQRSGSVAGARSDQANVTMDGVDVNDPQFGTAFTTVLRATLDSTQEFRVTTSNYGADQGRSSSAQLALVTKSGTNDLHGTLYWYHRNTATSANEYFLKLAQAAETPPRNQPPRLQKHIYGASAGGAVVKNRFFLFGNFESLRENSATPVDRTVPSSSFRDGILIYRCAVAAACPGGTVAGFTGSHTVPAGYYGLTPAQQAAIDPLGIGPSRAASAHFRNYPAPNAPGRDGIAGTTTGNIVGLTFASPINNVFYTYILRADLNIDRAGKHTLFWRGNLQDDVIGGVNQFPGAPPNTKRLVNNKGMAVGYNAALTSRFTNVFRYGLTRLSDETAGLRSSNAVVFRFISDLNALTSSLGRIIPTHNIVEDMSYTRGRHTFQWGANLRFSRVPRYSNLASFHTATANGSWVDGVGRTYTPGRTTCTTPGCGAVPVVHPAYAAVYADSLINIWGILSQASARYNYNRDGSTLPVGAPVTRKYGSNEYEFYFQDSWRIRPTLTFNFGVRYSLFSPPWEVNGIQVAPEIPMPDGRSIGLGEWFRIRGQNAALGIPDNTLPLIQVVLAGPANNRRGFYDWDKNNWSPRLSVAWNPRFTGGPLGWLFGQGKTVFRGGYALMYDRIGQALATQFNDVGSFGLSTSLTSPFGVNNEDTPGIRFVNITTMPPSLLPAPPGGFPQTPPTASGTITQSIDDTLTTPRAHTFNFMIGREMPGDMTLEIGYINRRGRDLLIRQDLAMPLNLVDPSSGMDYYTAATLAIQAGAAITSSAASAWRGVAPIPYWENMFPNAGAFANRGLTSTQEIARRFWIDSPDYITSLWLFDQFCRTTQPAPTVIGRRACPRFGPYSYFNSQYDSLGGQSTIGWSNYDAMLITLRKRPSHGLQFDFNYTLSKSLDIGSGVERGSSFTDFFSGGYTGFLLDSWNPGKHYAQSDFDVRHQLNVNWIYELPVGRGRGLGNNVPGWLNQIIGDWQVSGLWRMTSGFPFNVINCRSCWPTNWNLQGNAGLTTPGQLPELGTTRNAVGGRPSPFRDPVAAREMFRFVYPGEVGLRNVLRGDGYFVIDLGLSKTWTMPYSEKHKLKFRWETFNLTNTPKFDTGNLSMFPDIAASFGRYNGTLASCDAAAGRCMQFAFRYEF